MLRAIRQPKDLLSGLIFILFGGAFLLDIFIGNYAFGTVRRMGPGWFPAMVSILLIAIGVAVALKSFIGHREAGPTFAWQPLALISAALGVFTVLLRPAGVVPAVILLVLASAAAYRPHRTTPLLVSMVVLCAVLGPPTWILEYVLPATETTIMVIAWIASAAIIVGLVLAFEPAPLFKMTLAAIGLGLFCGIVFVMGLGLPMPKFGPYLDQIIDPVLISFREQWIDPVMSAVRSLFSRGTR